MRVHTVWEYVQGFCKTKHYLLLANFFLVFFLIVLSRLHVLPFGKGDFLFFSILTLAFSLYRPGWSFLFFIGTIAIENISAAPLELGIEVRPYQFLGALTLIAMVIRFFGGRLPYKPIQFSWQDMLLFIIGFSSIVTVFMSEHVMSDIKQVIVFFSFLGLYFLVRYYVQDMYDLKKVTPFFVSAALVIAVYGIWQNMQFARGLPSFEIMPGRPNATFTEPDWLGMYLVLLAALIYSLIWHVNKTGGNIVSLVSNFHPEYSGLISNKFQNIKFQILNLFLFALLILVYILLILTVSRSAWLGVTVVTISFLVTVLTKLKWRGALWQWKEGGAYTIKIACSIGISILVVYNANLTSFNLFNRAQSTGSGLQLITLACLENIDAVYPREIKDISEVSRYGCRHINLEDIEKEKGAGNIIIEVSRPDPNISIRKTIYQKSWNEIKAHPLAGIGWGSIGEKLGKDAQGNSFNTSNIFLETWLGAGIAGLISFLALWIIIFIKSIFSFLQQGNAAENKLGLFLMLGSEAILVTNLFNAGMFLGILFLFFAISNVKSDSSLCISFPRHACRGNPVFKLKDEINNESNFDSPSL